MSSQLSSGSEDAIELSIVVPVFNSDKSLRELFERFRTVLKQVDVIRWELILVDDGSPRADTWRTVAALAREFEQVRAFRLSRNFGKAGAVLCGFSKVRGKHVLTIDDDLEQRPEDFSELWKLRHHDVVIGQFRGQGHGWFVRTSSRVKSWFDRVLIGKPKGIKFTPYKLYRRYVVDAMMNIKTPFPFISGLMLIVTTDIVNVRVGHERRSEGKPGFTFRKRLKQFMNLLINHSSLLLQLIALLGITFSIISLVYGGIVVYRAVVDETVIAGWPSLMVTVLFIGGAMLFSLGVIGEYLLRIIKGVEKRPAFVIREQAGDETC